VVAGISRPKNEIATDNVNRPAWHSLSCVAGQLRDATYNEKTLDKRNMVR
jgi:hypothetical protein